MEGNVSRIEKWCEKHLDWGFVNKIVRGRHVVELRLQEAATSLVLVVQIPNARDSHLGPKHVSQQLYAFDDS